jgi:hypothetical protein
VNIKDHTVSALVNTTDRTISVGEYQRSHYFGW